MLKDATPTGKVENITIESKLSFWVYVLFHLVIKEIEPNPVFHFLINIRTTSHYFCILSLLLLLLFIIIYYYYLLLLYHYYHYYYYYYHYYYYYLLLLLLSL